MRAERPQKLDHLAMSIAKMSMGGYVDIKETKLAWYLSVEVLASSPKEFKSEVLKLGEEIDPNIGIRFVDVCRVRV